MGMATMMYQLAMRVASDVGAVATLQGDTSGITLIRKQLVADLTKSSLTPISPMSKQNG
jgi:hypothetical protein